LRLLRCATWQFRALQLGIDVTGIVMLAVAAETQQRGDDQLRAVAFARSRHRFSHDFEACEQIGGIHRVAIDSVAGGFVNKVVACELARGRRGVGVLVVGDHNDQGQLLHGCQVDRFVKSPRGRAAVTDASGADDVRDALKSPREKRARDGRNHRAEVADHCEVTIFRPAAVDVSIASAHRTQTRAQVGARRIKQALAECQPPRLIANQRREDVALAKRDSGRRTQGLLASAEKNAALDFSAAIEARVFLLGKPREQHEMVSLEIFVPRNCGCFSGSGALYCLNHGRSLSGFAPSVQIFLRAGYREPCRCSKPVIANGASGPCG
jgi:hypothetical protein